MWSSAYTLEYLKNYLKISVEQLKDISDISGMALVAFIGI
jgi:hypothetical protein